MHLIAIEPYFGGSHRAFLENLVARSRHRWSQLTLPPRHWKWRMRSAPVTLKTMFRRCVQEHGRPDAVFCSDMLDVPVWLGLAMREHPWLAKTPIVTYFHENQWAYPPAPEARIDHHYGYTNLLSAIASDECWFNSQHNLRSFLDGSMEFLRRMPDSQPEHDVDRLKAKSRIIPPGFAISADATQREEPQQDSSQPFRIGWVGRFEHDKRPDRFFQLLNELRSRSLDFELILLGQRGSQSESLDQITAAFSDQIIHDGFAKSRSEYEHLLRQMDVVVSTAEHEFFGIAICEAIACGAVPVTPNGLSYPEYIPPASRYDSIDQAAQMIVSFSHARPPSLLAECQENIRDYRIESVVQTMDSRFEELNRRP